VCEEMTSRRSKAVSTRKARREMTIEQEEAIKNAASAFIAARKAGVEEFLLIEEVFDASNAWTISELNILKRQSQEK
jgi:hypothetical protein